MAEEEEVAAELEAVEAVYGEDCVVLETYPPHFHLLIKPRTADVSSEQFVEAVIDIRASTQYPDVPPDISIVDSKGLDERRQQELITTISDKACELSSCLMLVALCEEAVERLSNMNHPDGDCPLCLYPLVDEEAGNDSLPFMKLMSCFHCFHRGCIMRWWNWLHMQKETDGATTFRSGSKNQQGMQDKLGESMGTCPVCREVFHAKDIEHVLDLVGNHFPLASIGNEADDDNMLLLSDSEKIRRDKFEALLKLQQEKDGLIEPKKHEVLQPGMFLARPTALPSTAPDEEATEQQQEQTRVTPTTKSSGPCNKTGTSEQRSFSRRNHSHRGHHARRNVRHWARKESDTKN